MNELTITIESVNKYGMSFWAGVEGTNLGAYGRTAWQALTEAVGLAVRDAELKAQKAQEPGAMADQRWEAKCKAEEVKGSAGMATKLTVKADALMELFSSGGLIYSRNGYWYYNSGRVHATQAKAILSAGYIKEFRQTGPFKKFYELTDAGREYASERGWLPTDTIPNGQPTPTAQAQASDVVTATEGRAAAEHTLAVAAEDPKDAEIARLRENETALKNDLRQFVGVFNALSKGVTQVSYPDDRLTIWQYRVSLTNEEHERLSGIAGKLWASDNLEIDTN